MGIDGSEIKKTSDLLESRNKAMQRNLSICTTCQKQVSKNAETCPHCGEPQGVASTGSNAASIDKYYKIYGIIGSALLALGVFCPVFSVPISGDINLFRNGEGDGVAILIFAVISVICLFVGKTRYLWYSGTGILILLGFIFYQFRTKISEIKENMHHDLAGNPLSGLADMAVNSVSMQWGWGLLLVGCLLIFAAAYCQNEQIATT